MKKFIKDSVSINEQDLKNITGGKYYGNGVYCGKKTCQVDWGQAWGAIGNNLASSLGDSLRPTSDAQHISINW